MSERVIVVNANSAIFQLALLISHLKWSLHGHHGYYFTIKATNLAGLSIRQTSVEYRHDVQLPSRGIVTDMPISQSSSQQPKICGIIRSNTNKNFSKFWIMYLNN
jgi:hypothetical protein